MNNNTNTQAAYTSDIVTMLNQLPENEASAKLVRRIWKLLLRFIHPEA